MNLNTLMISSAKQFILLSLAWAALSSPSSAGIVLTFSIDDGVTFGDTFDISTGETTRVGIYLSETPPDTVLTDDGLFGYGLIGELESNLFGEIVGSSVAPAFDTVLTNDFSIDSLRSEAAAFSNAIPTGDHLLLGFFDFESIGEGSSLLSFGDISPGVGSANASWVSGVGSDLDQSIFGSGAADRFGLTLNSVAAVPEPSSFGIASVSIFFLTRRLKRRRRNLQAPTYS